MSATDDLHTAALEYAAEQGWSKPVPPPAAVPLFDGRASVAPTPFPTTTGLVVPPGTGTVTVTPPLPYGQWTEYAYQDADVRKVADDRYGTVYLAAPAAGHRSPWNWKAVPGSTDARMDVRRTNDIGKTWWYSDAYMLLSAGLVWPDWGTVLDLGYETVQYDQVGLQVYGDTKAWTLYQNAGLITDKTRGFPFRSAPLTPVQLDKWADWVIGVTWAADSTGMVEVHYRPQGGAWSKLLTRAGVPTYAWTQTPPNVPATVLDKQGVYFGWWNEQQTPAPTGQVKFRGMQRWASLADAIASLG